VTRPDIQFSRMIELVRTYEEKLAKMRGGEVKLLDDFCRFAEKTGYLDCDWYAEKPTLIDRFWMDRMGQK
jgi:hypothetical protein